MKDERVSAVRRRFPAGAEVIAGTGVHVRVWAPTRTQIDVVGADQGARWPLEPEEEGYWSALIPELRTGDRYWLCLDGNQLRPDPCSRFQPEGPHGPSQVVDPTAFAWSDAAWRGVRREGQILYEMHVGTFTHAGTWRAAIDHLPALARLGITVIEMMPVCEFAGEFGWGYDGVDLYAPTHLYGEPDDLRVFVNRAHELGLGVILDVVYNHLGPDGNYLEEFSPDYFTDKYENDWGRAINFEGPSPAREFFVANAAYWIDEYHFDGLRLDATQDVHDESSEHVLHSIVVRARAAAGTRSVYLVAENEPQRARLVRDPARGGYGLDALWNDDFHHTSVVALTGRREAYYTDYKGSTQELISCAKYGFLYQGQHYSWQKQRRGRPALDLPHCAFVAFMENHDQVANSAFGRRLHQLTSPGRLRAMTALMLLGPATPLLFQGQEFNSSAPFLYFADHKKELRESIRAGRREFLAQFDSLKDPSVMEQLPSPTHRQQFERCKLDQSERDAHPEARLLYEDLIALRRGDDVIGRGRARIDGAVVVPEALVIRYFGGDAGDRLLLVNLGCDLDVTPCPEPLLAPPADGDWVLTWSSESPRYSGQGTAPVHTDGQWRIPGECALLLTAIEPSR
jgi:maltooligosyltrehalose trehalohydrolase